MKSSIFHFQFSNMLILLAAVGLTSCFPVRIVTTAPTQTVTVRPTQTVTTVSTVPASTSHPTVTTTVQVNALTSDLSYYLDLQAVAAAFAQSSTVREFEEYLNSSRYMINNLDGRSLTVLAGSKLIYTVSFISKNSSKLIFIKCFQPVKTNLLILSEFSF